jgi:hypothetical protein
MIYTKYIHIHINIYIYTHIPNSPSRFSTLFLQTSASSKGIPTILKDPSRTLGLQAVVDDVVVVTVVEPEMSTSSP